MSASAITLLDVVNKIMIRLRDQAVTSITSTIESTGGTPAYTDTVVRLINDARREVEDCFNWTALQQTITLTTVSGTKLYNLEDTTAEVYSNQRTRVLDVYNTTTDARLIPRPFDWVRKQSQISSSTNQEPFAYAVAGYNASQTIQLQLFETPDAIYSIDVECIIPQEDLTANTDYFKVPWYPVYLRSLALAIRERGEDEGEQSSKVEAVYRQAIGNAIAYEQQHKWQGQGGGDWIVLGDY